MQTDFDATEKSSPRMAEPPGYSTKYGERGEFSVEGDEANLFHAQVELHRLIDFWNKHSDEIGKDKHVSQKVRRMCLGISSFLKAAGIGERTNEIAEMSRVWKGVDLQAEHAECLGA